MNGHISLRSWIRLLALAAGSFVGAGVVARAAHAEGVLGNNSLAAGHSAGARSLVGALGDAALQAPAVNAVSMAPLQNALRPTMPGQPTPATRDVDFFQLSRLALPLVMQAAVGRTPEAELAATVRPMKGQMVGFRPDPRSWGSMFDR